MSLYDIEFTIPGNPKALKRHRTVRKGDFITNYDPSEGDKADFLAISMEHKPEIPFDEPLSVYYTFAFSRPKAHYRTGAYSHLLKPSAPKWHISTPDMDNLMKFINDAYNGHFWKDDSRICHAVENKIYDDRPYIKIQITRLNKFKK